MAFRDFIMQDLAFKTRNDFLHFNNNRRRQNIAALSNFIKVILLLIPIVSTVFGIVSLTIMELQRKRGINIGNRIHSTIVLSFCIASLGILLLPLMIAGTILNLQGQARHQPPGLTNKKIKEIPPDYLL